MRTDRLMAAAAQFASPLTAAAGGALLPPGAFETLLSSSETFAPFAHCDVNDAGEWVGRYGTLIPEVGFGLFGPDGPITAPAQQIEYTPGVYGTLTNISAGLSLNNHGDFAVAARFNVPQFGLNWVAMDDLNMLIVPGQAPGYDAEGVYGDFKMDVVKGDSGRVLSSAYLTSNFLPTGNALVTFTPDGAGGYIEEAVAAPGTPYKDGLVFTRAWANEGDYFDMNAKDQVIFRAGVASPDGSYFADNLFIDDEVIATDGGPSPLPGFIYNIGGFSAAAINDRGDYAFIISAHDAQTGDPTQIAVRNGELLFTATDVGIGRLNPGEFQLDNAGRLFWSDSLTNDAGENVLAIFENDAPIIQEGSTVIDGAILTKIRGAAFGLSDDGRWLTFVGELDDGSGNRLFRVSIPGPGTAVLLLLPLLAQPRPRRRP